MSALIQTLRIAHEKSTADLNVFREATFKTVNTMFNDVVHSLELKHTLDVFFSAVGGEPVVMYGGHRVFFSGYRAFVKIDGETVEYEELEPLGSAIIAAEIITMRYRMATPKDIHIPAGD